MKIYVILITCFFVSCNLFLNLWIFLRYFCFILGVIKFIRMWLRVALLLLSATKSLQRSFRLESHVSHQFRKYSFQYYMSITTSHCICCFWTEFLLHSFFFFSLNYLANKQLLSTYYVLKTHFSTWEIQNNIFSSKTYLQV